MSFIKDLDYLDKLLSFYNICSLKTLSLPSVSRDLKNSLVSYFHLSLHIFPDPACSKPHVLLYASLPMVVSSFRDVVQPPHRAHLPFLHLLGQADVHGQRSNPDPVPGSCQCSPAHKGLMITSTAVNGGIMCGKPVFLQFHLSIECWEFVGPM